jgi:hypothetical protein
MNKYIQIFKVSVFVLGMSLLLSLYFDLSNLSIGVLLGFGLLGGILSRFFVGYVIPNRIIFRARFIIYGIGFGIFIGLIMLLTNKDQSFAIIDLVILFLISVPIGLISIGIMSYLRFRKLKKKTIGKHESKVVISDLAVYTYSKNKPIRGLLVLSVDKLSFYSMTNQDCLFETPLLDLNPEIKKSQFMSIPTGFSFMNKMYSLNMAFPLYWIQLIGTEKIKTTTQHAV